MELPHFHDGKKHIPIPSGKYVVGCTDIDVGPDFKDGCLLRLFYPTNLTNVYEHSSKWATWLPHSKYVEGYNTVVGWIPFFGNQAISWALGNTYIPAVVDAVPTDEQKFPVIVFSHGLSACRTAYSQFCSELASNGFIVAAVEHRDESACMTYNLEKDEETGALVEKWIPYKPMPFEKNELPQRKEQLLVRTNNCQKVLDFLYKLNNGEATGDVLRTTVCLKDFKGIMDMSTPVIAGHSFGSATLLRTLAADKRFKVGVALDAWMWPLRDEPELAGKVDQPILFINMETFQNESSLNTMKRFTLDSGDVERRVVTIKKTVHRNQVDLPFVLSPYLRRFAGAKSAIDPFLCMELNNKITLLYLRKHLGHPENEEHFKLVAENAEWFYEGIA